ncbi:hypothetical protein CHLRE_07g325753v5 [Chlamydomonas reinhardtii]|uniref:Uncharacterized protein n=1 Tax=Chlamydomonas reinhardtii TaxID=3055 RepID=A0A2K3DJH9_CHLRE|nr:uncharacterized protein CHLRE_07g325753v5 [Chlamydomonas reinhardtii]PNW80678.1 hypothetical protein CHLRE_07g325753v5 [Chlamydomonas reinhardtii]
MLSYVVSDVTWRKWILNLVLGRVFLLLVANTKLVTIAFSSSRSDWASDPVFTRGRTLFLGLGLRLACRDELCDVRGSLPYADKERGHVGTSVLLLR